MTYDDNSNADFRAADEQMSALFAAARPAAGFEDRLIHHLRAASERRFRLPRPIRLHPAIHKSAAAAAAAVVLAGVGYAVKSVLHQTPEQTVVTTSAIPTSRPVSQAGDRSWQDAPSTQAHDTQWAM